MVHIFYHLTDLLEPAAVQTWPSCPVGSEETVSAWAEQWAALPTLPPALSAERANVKDILGH